MATMTASVLTPCEASNFDELSMQDNLLLSDSLQDLKNLRTQLYSAAEYFELSYTSDEQKDIVVATLKDYAIKAFVNTVDHLGSATYKANDLLDEKVDEVSGTELRVSCIEQRLRTCQEYIDHEGCSQQSLVIDTPKYHKRYILPGNLFCSHMSSLMHIFPCPWFDDYPVKNFGVLKFSTSSSVAETISDANGTKSLYHGCSLDDEGDWHQFRNAVRDTIRETQTSSVRTGSSQSPSQRPSPQNFSFKVTTSKKEIDKRTVSPHRFPLLRTGSSSSRPTTPKTSRPTTPNPSAARQLYPSGPRKSASVRFPSDREHSKNIEQYPSKSKRLLKALLSRRKYKKDDMLYTYLDEY